MKNNNNLTPLMEAIRYEKKNFIPMLLKSKADVNAQNHEGISALMIAVTLNRIEAGANVNAQGENGITALILASSEEIVANPKIKEILIKAGAK